MLLLLIEQIPAARCDQKPSQKYEHLQILMGLININRIVL